METKTPRKPLKGRGRKAKEGSDNVATLPETEFKYVEGYTGELQSTTNAILSIACNDNPQLLSAMQEILNELGRLNLAVYGAPVVKEFESGLGLKGEPPPVPLNFTYQLTKTNVILYWLPASADFHYFEVRKGTIWETADKILVTGNTSAILNPVLVGTHTYLVRSIDIEGLFSVEIALTSFIVPPIGPFVLTSSVIAESVTLSWTIPASTFKIDYYIVRRNGIQLAANDGTFFAISEEIGGTYTYSVIAVDLAGNQSLPAETTLVTTGLTDYVFYSTKHWLRNGTIFQGIFRDLRLYFCIITETYQQHFDTRSWASPANQVSAGYSVWSSPYATTGSYEEIFDFTTPISNVIVTITHSFDLIFGNFTIGYQSYYSTNGTDWSPVQTISSYFATSVRYVKVKVNVTAQNDKSLMALTDLAVSLNVKRENDGGESVSYASDPIGSWVQFNKDGDPPGTPQFIDVEAITVTPISTTSTFATHEFVDTPYPTGFRVRIFDNSGVRITRGFRWNSRGII